MGLLVAALGGCSPRGGPGPSVLLVTLDGVRADRLGSYGHAKARTPSLDALAREGALFEQAYTAAPLCRPAVVTILTGRSPRSHGVREDAGESLKAEAPLLAEAFRGHGYRTAAFVGVDAVGRSSGLSRGFEEFVDDFGVAGKQSGRGESATPRETVDAAVRWLGSGRPTAPAFVWVHLRRAPAQAVRDAGQGGDAYDASLTATDRELGRLVEAARRSASPLVVAVLADHGEALGDHGEPTFGYFVYSATTRVPLIIAVPQGPSGRRLRPIVRAMDVAPTLLELARLPAMAPAVEGASLVPLMTGRTAEGPGPAVIENASLESRFGISPLFAVRSGAHLYVQAPRPELYDTDQDPAEKDDAIERLSKVAKRLAGEVARWAPEARPELMDPKDGIDLYLRFRDAQSLEARGERGGALEAYRGILKDAPGFVFAQRKLAEGLLRDGNLAEGGRLLEDLLTRRLGNDTTYLNLALVRFRAGDNEGALRRLREGAQAFPTSAALRHRAGRVLLGMKRPGEALEELDRALELEPRLVDAHLGRGEALEALGRKREAEAAYRRVLEVAEPASDAARQATAALAGSSGSRQ